MLFPSPIFLLATLNLEQDHKRWLLRRDLIMQHMADLRLSFDGVSQEKGTPYESDNMGERRLS
jgi:hypothetical protein